MLSVDKNLADVLAPYSFAFSLLKYSAKYITAMKVTQSLEWLMSFTVAVSY